MSLRLKPGQIAPTGWNGLITVMEKTREQKLEEEVAFLRDVIKHLLKK